MTELSVSGPSATALRAGWKWLLALGILQALIGLIALSAPMIVTVVSAMFFGWLLLFAGVFQIVQAFRCPGWRGMVWQLLGGILAVIAGAWIAFVPLGGALGLTMILATFLVIGGILRAVLALRVRPEPGWLGFLIAGIAAVVLGIIMWARPGAALWLIGFLIGFDLLLHGLTMAATAWRLRSIQTG